MNRRSFLQFVGAFTCAAAVPAFGLEKIARLSQPWMQDLPRFLYRTAKPLAAGSYTFTAGVGDLGMYFGQVIATGGETVFEVLETKGRSYTDARLKLGGITVNMGDFTDKKVTDKFMRGNRVNPV